MASGFLPFGKSLSCLSSLVHAIDRHRWNSLAFLITFKRLLKNHTTLEELLVPVKPVLTKWEVSGPPRCVHSLRCQTTCALYNLLPATSSGLASNLVFIIWLLMSVSPQGRINQTTLQLLHSSLMNWNYKPLFRRNESQCGVFREPNFGDFDLKNHWWFRLLYLEPHSSCHLITTEGAWLKSVGLP